MTFIQIVGLIIVIVCLYNDYLKRKTSNEPKNVEQEQSIVKIHPGDTQTTYFITPERATSVEDMIPHHSSSMSFSIESWLFTNTFELYGSKKTTSVHRLKRTGTMNWEWRLFEYSEKTSYDEVNLDEGFNYSARKSAYAEFIELEDYYAHLSSAYPNDILCDYTHKDNRSRKMIHNLGLSAVFDALTKKHEKIQNEWEEVPHAIMIRLENIFNYYARKEKDRIDFEKSA